MYNRSYIRPSSGVISFNYNKLLSLRNPQNSDEEVIEVEDGLWGTALTPILLASGFRQIAADNTMTYFLPCPVGTFTNPSTDGEQVCTPCPPGMQTAILINVVGSKIQAYTTIPKVSVGRSRGCSTC